jgi:hypothetical protein
VTNRRSFRPVGVLASVVVGLALVLGACTTTTPPRPVVIPETTKVSDAATHAALVEFDTATGTLRFDEATPLLAGLAVGDVLVSEPSAAAPGGYLRKVTAVRHEAGGTILETAPAALTDAIHSGEADVSGRLRPSDVANVVTPVPGVTVALATSPGDSAHSSASLVSQGYDHEVTFDVVLDLEAEEDGAEAKGQVRVAGTIRFSAGYDIGLGVEPCARIPPVCVDRFEARIGLDQYVDMRLSALLDGRVAREQVITSFHYDPIVIWIGPVPVVFVPKIDVVIGANGEARTTFTVRVEESVRFVLGAKWTDDAGWRDLSDQNGFAHRASPPDFTATMRLRGYAKADAALLLYAVAGPAAHARLGGGVDVRLPGQPVWTVFGHLAAGVSFKIDIASILGTDLFEADAFEVEPVLLTAGNMPPRFSDVVTTVIFVDIATNVVLGPRSGFQGYFAVSDPEGEPLTLSAVSNVDGPIGLTARFETPGRRDVTVTARDPHGAQASIVLRLDVRNGLPIITTTVGSTTTPATVPYFIAAYAYDPETGPLDCVSLTWSADAPDQVQPVDNAGGCGAWVVFHVEGTRSVRVTATDRHGGSATAIVVVTVTAPPENLPPVITSVSIQAATGPITFWCVTGYYCEVPAGAVLHNGVEGDYHLPLYLSVEAYDPEGDPLTVTWTCRAGATVVPVTDLGDGTFSCSPGYNSARTADVTVVVSDGNSAASPYTRSFVYLERLN